MRRYALYRVPVLVFYVSVKATQQSQGQGLTWKGGVDREARHTCNFILSSIAVIGPVAGFVQWNELHRTLAEKIFAVNQLLDWMETERHIGREGQK